jgi:hypothetical protein
MTVPFQLKLPKDLHKEIKMKAIKAEKSMHAYILDCIKGYGLAEDLVRDVKEQPKECEHEHKVNENGDLQCKKCHEILEQEYTEHYSAIVPSETKSKGIKVKKPTIGYPKSKSLK